MLEIIGMVGLVAVIISLLVLAVYLRVVVPTNMVHIVQSKKKTTSFGARRPAGNVYWRWPSFIPFLGVTVIRLQVSNFDLKLTDYEAYDKDRVPFLVDVVAFMRIQDTDVAAEKITDRSELEAQLMEIVRGAVRKVLADDVIDDIMLQRAKFGQAFTQEVEQQLKEWGVVPVKSMELMDIRDVPNGQVIANIMAKKTSEIEKDSRVEVARNRQIAEAAEIEAKRTVDLAQQEAEQQVGERTAQKQQAVGIANQRGQQAVLTEEKTTKQNAMDVARVEQVAQAEIQRDAAKVAAQQDAETTEIRATGQLEAKKREAEGIRVDGTARADAEKAMQMAPVEAKIALAQALDGNPAYLEYLLGIEQVNAHESIGSAQAVALQGADVKIIANAGDASGGMTSAMELFTPKGGTNMGAALEAFLQTPAVQALKKQLLEGRGAGNAAAGAPTAPVAEPEVVFGEDEDAVDDEEELEEAR